MPTRRGWLLAAGAVALIVAGRLLGVVELFALGAAAAAACAFALSYVRLTRYQLEASRSLHPARVHAGGASRVELAVRNTGRKRSPILAVRDPFEGGRRWARFLLAPLDPGEQARAAYRLPTDQRGVFELGPLQLHLGDPLGLATATIVAAGATKLTVYPRIETVEPLPDTLGHDPYAGAEHPTAIARGGEDFYALRPYELGDDLRRVHWPSTAKLDELMIRQDEMPWQGRSTVMLDLRHSVHTHESLEAAISAAASVIHACWRRRALVRLATTGGLDTQFAAGAPHVEAILEHLATAKADSAASLAPLLASLRRDGNGGAIAVITTARATDQDRRAIAGLHSRFGAVSLVLLDGEGTAARPPVGGVSLVPVERGRPFAPAWDAAAGARR